MNSFLLDNENMVDLLIKNGSNINIKADDGTTPLHWAALKGDFQHYKFIVVKKIL